MVRERSTQRAFAENPGAAERENGPDHQGPGCCPNEPAFALTV